MRGVWWLPQGTSARSVGQLRSNLLAVRGIAAGSAQSFFTPAYDHDVHDPASITDMLLAVERIKKAARAGERVLVHGDYDADGITGTAIVLTALKRCGIAAMPYLPHRLEDGYGLNPAVLKRLEAEFDLLVTVDCGISNAAEIRALQETGRDTIVLDHHTLPRELPPALAILHPARGNYGTPYLSGAGVAWKFAQALWREWGDAIESEEEKWLLDLCCIGTVADMVPLRGENRAIARFGLEVMRRSPRPAIRLLRAGMDNPIDTDFISFKVAPLLNAAGRMEHAQPALDFLLARSDDRARELITRLKRYNELRRNVSRKIQEEAESLVEREAPVLFVYSRSWPAGVVGLVAGRLSKKFERPAVVVGSGGAHAVGSVRAPVGINVMKMLAAGREHMLKLGGHARAAGFSLEHRQVVGLQEKLLREVKGKQAALEPSRKADALVDPRLISWESWEMLESFRPFGEGNARPVLVLREVSVASWRAVGKTGDHAKFDLIVGEQRVDGIGFDLVAEGVAQAVEPGEKADVMFNLDMNEFRGRKRLQLQVLDIAPAGEVDIVCSK